MTENQTGYGQHEVPDNPRDVASQLAGLRPDQTQLIFTLTRKDSGDPDAPANPEVAYTTEGDLQIMEACAALSALWSEMVMQSMRMAQASGTPFDSFEDASRAITGELQRRELHARARREGKTFEQVTAEQRVRSNENIQTVEVVHESQEPEPEFGDEQIIELTEEELAEDQPQAQDDLDYINGTGRDEPESKA